MGTGQINNAGETKAIYDGLGQRVQLAENGTVRNMVYDISGKLIAEYGLTPRPFRALNILHELAHALNLIPNDRRAVDRTGTQSDMNNECP